MFTSDYWDKRVEKNGHTGHSEPFYYCFDQQARIYAIESLLNSFKTNLTSVLDFGCGSGDFLELLSNYSKKVYGFDPSKKVVALAQKKHQGKEIIITSQLNDCILTSGFNCILTVTVLQSLSLPELTETLPKLLSLLSNEGKLICMEFFVSDDYQLQNNELKTSERDWKNLLEKNKIDIKSKSGFYNPHLFPSKSWKLYNSSFTALLLKPFKKFSFAQKSLTKRAKKLIWQEKDVYPFPSSSFKIYVLEKSR
jgi:SAM-dependent methyltransferase